MMKSVENLAKCTALMLLESAGLTKGMAERAWEDDVEGRKVFLQFAQIHAELILKEEAA